MTGDELKGHLRDTINPAAVAALVQKYGIQRKEARESVPSRTRCHQPNILSLLGRSTRCLAA